MSGFDAMLKNILGVDPKEIREKIQQALPMLQNMATEVQKTLVHFDNRLKVIEAQNAQILALMQAQNLHSLTASNHVNGASENGRITEIEG